jgi:hypothetical protein
MYTGQDRRQNDQLLERIEGLILTSTDPKDKAFLLILNRMADNLQENTELTRKLGEELTSHTKAFTEHTITFSEHEKKEMELINQGRGGWKVIAVFVLFLQGISGWWIQDKLAEITQIKADVGMLTLELATQKERHRGEDKNKAMVSAPNE